MTKTPKAGAEDIPAGASAENTDANPESESIQVYARFKTVFGDPSSRTSRSRRRIRAEAGSSVPYGAGREPHGIADVMESLTSQLGWNSPLAQSELLASWQQLAGEELAQHSRPVGIEDNVLTVQCESTAWTTQLRLMRNVILSHIWSKYPDAGIESIRFQGPNAPSWKRGPRSIPGRGPRDTYG